MIRTVEWRNGCVVMIDQRLLPGQEVYRVYRHHRDVAQAIRQMVVRGAPAIGVAAAMGVALAARRLKARGMEEGLERACGLLLAARPTAVNLAHAVERVLRRPDAVEDEARAIHRFEVSACDAMARHGAPLLAGARSVMTYCNTGHLATGGAGTALGVIRAARAAHVWVPETRPLLQGARLTAWE
ncbi:MAG: S-methyl-5-thioribose-1-phosphate isomerase, partial [Candidatus Binatia bacterium]